MKKKINIVLVLLATIGFAACTTDNPVPQFEVKGAAVKTTTEEVDLTFSYQKFGNFKALHLYFADNPEMKNAHFYDLTSKTASSDSVTIHIDNLFPGHTYYYHYVMNFAYDSQQTKVAQFTTNTGTPPVVTTEKPSRVKHNSCNCSGVIVNTGDCQIRDCGICWGYTRDIDINNANVVPGEPTAKNTFTITLNDLENDTEYYVRSYARNVLGITYGEVIGFRTSKGIQITTSVVIPSATEARSGGTITNAEGFSIKQRGLCWSTEPNPTIDDINDHRTYESLGASSGVGSFESTMKNLTPNTVYYVRAYAECASEVFYGDEHQFTTTNN